MENNELRATLFEETDGTFKARLQNELERTNGKKWSNVINKVSLQPSNTINIEHCIGEKELDKKDINALRMKLQRKVGKAKRYFTGFGGNYFVLFDLETCRLMFADITKTEDGKFRSLIVGYINQDKALNGKGGGLMYNSIAHQSGHVKEQPVMFEPSFNYKANPLVQAQDRIKELEAELAEAKALIAELRKGNETEQKPVVAQQRVSVCSNVEIVSEIVGLEPDADTISYEEWVQSHMHEREVLVAIGRETIEHSLENKNLEQFNSIVDLLNRGWKVYPDHSHGDIYETFKLMWGSDYFTMFENTIVEKEAEVESQRIQANMEASYPDIDNQLDDIEVWL